MEVGAPRRALHGGHVRGQAGQRGPDARTEVRRRRKSFLFFIFFHFFFHSRPLLLPLSLTSFFFCFLISLFLSLTPSQPT